MKIEIQVGLWVIASILQINCQCGPVPAVSDFAPVTVPLAGASAPHNSYGAAVVNPDDESSNGADSPAKQSQKCITFTSDNPEWYYTNAAPWVGNGVLGEGPTEICVNSSDSAGGAMFIAPGPDTPPGSTKLECYFPTSGTANCDVSLVDGYSLSVTCTAANSNTPSIGGGIDLWKTGASCNDSSLINQGICKNDQGYAPDQSDVTPFFQNAIQNGNNYCIWVDCGQDYFFDVEEALQCHVSGGQ